jgi:hypothetical protein
VQEQVRQRTEARARAQVQRDAARAAAEQARDRMKKEFGVESPEQGREVLERLQSDLESTLAEAEAALGRTTI